MPITLAERIDELNDLIENVKSKQESLKAAAEKLVNELNETMDGNSHKES